MQPPDQFSEQLAGLQSGGDYALEELTSVVYTELHRIARRVWGQQQPGHTLQPTVLIHEAYLKLVKQNGRAFQSRAHFLAVASIAMRQVLVNHAESRVTAKRGGKNHAVPLDEAQTASLQDESDVLLLHEALQKLSDFDLRKARVVEMRYFGGLSLEETGEALGVSTVTVTRDWQTARAWLARELSSSR
jgi:RNA polymerase sigma factor (TIGR02999 family)